MPVREHLGIVASASTLNKELFPTLLAQSPGSVPCQPLHPGRKARATAETSLHLPWLKRKPRPSSSAIAQRVSHLHPLCVLSHCAARSSRRWVNGLKWFASGAGFTGLHKVAMPQPHAVCSLQPQGHPHSVIIRDGAGCFAASWPIAASGTHPTRVRTAPVGVHQNPGGHIRDHFRRITTHWHRLKWVCLPYPAPGRRQTLQCSDQRLRQSPGRCCAVLFAVLGCRSARTKCQPGPAPGPARSIAFTPGDGSNYLAPPARRSLLCVSGSPGASASPGQHPQQAAPMPWQLH